MQRSFALGYLPQLMSSRTPYEEGQTDLGAPVLAVPVVAVCEPVVPVAKEVCILKARDTVLDAPWLDVEPDRGCPFPTFAQESNARVVLACNAHVMPPITWPI